jgi:hypothetical protein
VSRASERKNMVQAIAGYALMGVPEFARLLDVDDDVAHGIVDSGAIPSLLIGKRKKLDPVDVAVYVLAVKERCSMPEYWQRYSEADVLENARRFYRHARTVAA